MEDDTAQARVVKLLAEVTLALRSSWAPIPIVTDEVVCVRVAHIVLLLVRQNTMKCVSPVPVSSFTLSRLRTRVRFTKDSGSAGEVASK